MSEAAHPKGTSRSQKPARRSKQAPAERSKINASKPFVVDFQVGFLLRALAQRNYEIFTRYMVADLTRVQFAAMAKLFEVGFCSQNELGRLILLDKASIQGVINRLKKRGFIDVRPDSVDRRQHILGLTKLGQRTVRKGIAAAPNITKEMLENLSERERTLIVRLLRKIVG
jgi:DNA-binding MarR family transcriptional regulator